MGDVAVASDESVRRFELIAQDLRRRIRSGELAPGDQVPSVRELVDSWSTSKVTVDRAMGMLRAEGLIETRVGARTTVVDRSRPAMTTPREHVERVTAGQSIYADNERSVKYRAGLRNTEDVDPAVVSAAGLPVPSELVVLEGTTIIERARVLYRDDIPRAAVTTWFNHPLIVQQPQGPELAARLGSVDARFPEGTRAAVARVCGVEYTHTVDRVGVRPVPESVADALGVDPATPMLWVLSTRFAGEYVLEVDEWWRFAEDDLTYTYS